MRPPFWARSTSFSGSVTDEPRLLARETLLMAARHLEPDSPEVRARWGSFTWTAENAAKAREAIARYPEGRQRSAVMPLLDLAQRQVGAETNTQGWLPIPVME